MALKTPLNGVNNYFKPSLTIIKPSMRHIFRPTSGSCWPGTLPSRHPVGPIVGSPEMVDDYQQGVPQSQCDINTIHPESACSKMNGVNTLFTPCKIFVVDAGIGIGFVTHYSKYWLSRYTPIIKPYSSIELHTRLNIKPLFYHCSIIA